MYERDRHTGRQTDGHRMTDNAALAQHRAANRPNGNKTININVKNFRESLTTVVRAQNDTAKTANITYHFRQNTGIALTSDSVLKIGQIRRSVFC